MKKKHVKLKQKISVVCVILLTVSIFLICGKVARNDSFVDVEAVGLTNYDLQGKNVLVVYGNQVVSVNNVGQGGYLYNPSNGAQYFWYNQQFCKDLMNSGKCSSHLPKRDDGNQYLLKCENCGQKSFDYDYLSGNWKKIKAVEDRLDSSMVIVFIPSEN